MPELTYLQAISDGLRTEMRRDKRVFLIGEDVGVYGGAFKVSLGFQEEFGDRKSTRLNSSHSQISYAVFCLKKKKYMFYSYLSSVTLSYSIYLCFSFLVA